MYYNLLDEMLSLASVRQCIRDGRKRKVTSVLAASKASGRQQKSHLAIGVRVY